MITKKEAQELVKDTSKHSHVLTVSNIMRKLAKRLGEKKDQWELVGLLHDLDYDQTRGDLSNHGILGSKILEEKLQKIVFMK